MGITPTDDDLYTEQWGLNNTGQTINAGSLYYASTGTANADADVPEAWAVAEGDGSVIAAVVDTGVAYSHPDLADNMWDGSSCVDENGTAIVGGCIHGYDYDDNDNDPAPDNDSINAGSYSHGTHIAGIIAGVDNAEGIVGLAPKTKIMAVKTAQLTTAELVKGIAFADQNGAKVINASWGGGSEGEANDILLKNAIKDFNGLFMAAAGNDSDNVDEETFFPCGFSLDETVTNIICVAATDQNDELAGFSNYGADSVLVGAPGENILSTVGEIENIDEKFDSTTVGEIPTGFTKTGNWQVANAPAEFGWATGDRVIFADNSLPYADSVNTTFSNNLTHDLSGSTTADLYFNTACDTEYDGATTNWHDYLALEYSSDGVNFTEITKWDEEALGTEAVGYRRGYFSNYIPVGYLTANFKLRFRWVTDADNNNYKGCLIDDLKLVTYKNSVNDVYDYYDGTSMATPFVVALADLMWETDADLTNNQVKNLIADSGDTLSDLQGKTISGKRINAHRALTVKTMNSFKFESLNPMVTGSISESNHTVSLTVPYGTNISALSPSIEYTGVAVSPASGVAQNFSNPVTYTVTSVDGTTQNYTVSVAVAAERTKQITLFEFRGLDPVVAGSINESSSTVSLKVPYGTNITSLSPTIVYTGSSVSPASGSAQNFSNPIIYTVYDSDGITKNYTVMVTVAENPAKQITGFSFNNLRNAVSGSIDENNKAISLTVPNGTNISSLTPNIVTTGASINPDSGVAQDFSSPRTYTVTAEDGTTTQYTASVTKTGEAYISRIQKSGKTKLVLTIEDLILSKQKKFKPTTGFINGRRVRISGTRVSGSRSIITVNWPYTKWPRGSYSFSFNYKLPISKKSYQAKNFTTAGNDFWL